MRCCRRCGDSKPTINISNRPCLTSIEGKNWKQFNVSERVGIEAGCPDIVSLVNVNVMASIIATNIIITPDSIDIENAEGTTLTGYKLIINGVLTQTIMYESDEVGSIYTIKSMEPFSTFVVMSPDYDFSKEPCVKVCIEDVLVDKINCRELLKNVAMLIRVS